jgi:hypothetical protein
MYDVDDEEHEAGPRCRKLGLHGNQRVVKPLGGDHSVGHRFSFERIRMVRDLQT